MNARTGQPIYWATFSEPYPTRFGNADYVMIASDFTKLGYGKLAKKLKHQLQTGYFNDLSFEFDNTKFYVRDLLHLPWRD